MKISKALKGNMLIQPRDLVGRSMFELCEATCRSRWKIYLFLNSKQDRLEKSKIRDNVGFLVDFERNFLTGLFCTSSWTYFLTTKEHDDRSEYTSQGFWSDSAWIGWCYKVARKPFQSWTTIASREIKTLLAPAPQILKIKDIQATDEASNSRFAISWSQFLLLL